MITVTIMENKKIKKPGWEYPRWEFLGWGFLGRGDSPVGSLIGGSSLGVNLPGRNFPDTSKYFSFTKVIAANVFLRPNYL